MEGGGTEAGEGREVEGGAQRQVVWRWGVGAQRQVRV